MLPLDISVNHDTLTYILTTPIIAFSGCGTNS